MTSDLDLIRRVQRGERELFGELHARHHERIYHFVARSIFQKETAQDVAGEVWLKAYHAVDGFKPQEESGALAWLLRIAANCVTDHRRRLKPETSLDEEENEGATLHLIAPAAENEMLRRESVRAVRRAISQLSTGDQQIIHLAHQQDLSCAEIMRILSKPTISATTSHLHRAMNHLRDKLSQSGWFNDVTNTDTEVKTHAFLEQKTQRQARR